MASSFNVVIGRPTLTKIRAVVSQSHLCMKFPTPMAIAILRGNQEMARHYYITSVTQPKKGKDHTPEAIPQRIPDNQQVMGVEITQIGTRLNSEERAELIAFLRPNNDVFMWTSENMPGIPPSVSQHKLSTNPLKKPVAQKRRLFGGERLQAIKEEVEKLLQIGFVRKVDYCEWVANPVLVKKANGNERLSLLDAYSGYHQVPMAPEDEEKTSFYAGYEIYCYVMMPFGLKNAGATYQKMVTIFFRAQIGRNLEVYVDDIVVNPEKIRAIAEMEPPKLVKDIQRLTRRVAALHRFITKSVDKYLPFFKIMRSAAQKDESGKQKKFEWNQEWQAAFDELKSYLTSPPLLTKAQRSAIRAQALADFIVECTPYPSTPNPEPNDWTLYVDGASNSKGSGACALLIGPDGYQSEHALKFNFDATNNMAEYEALLLGLQLVLELKITLVAELKCKFQKFCLSKIHRTENEQANSLSKFASDSSLSSRSVFVEVLDEPSFMKPRMMEISTDPDTPSWTDSIISFLRDGIVPEDRQEAMKLRKKASRYTLVDGALYKRSFSLPLLRCLNPYEAEYALREGYYWPNMYKDATHFVQKCPKCQFFAHLTHQRAEELTNLVAPWPFAQWGLDLLGPFVKGVGGVTHLIVGVDYFTKWVEAQPLSSLTSKKVEDFIFSSIICRYGILNQIVADNGTQFNCSSFQDFCSSYGIKLPFTSVYHPKSNSMDELNNILWAYRTTSRTATGETPYHLVFGTKVVIPIEIGVPSFRVTHFDERRNGQLLRENLDLLAEVREEARLRTLVYKQKLANFYNKRVCPRTFKVGDLVLRKVGLTGFETHFGKLASNWEGPYTMAEVPHPNAYVLQDVEGKRIPRVWNVNNLKKFYP
ncbi:hypothetical protein SLEP1_g24510 [Rubroshorea leprosula]|uniref:Integrase catalytic domain-containing protein n=1 Tax=Rubroshorea leprosula TaxID=152421 RepID=A0AAV5JT60_9ROSI|nr:hypothetical protein SLEP1_g24510 [Rubroshorea leprosula]